VKSACVGVLSIIEQHHVYENHFLVPSFGRRAVRGQNRPPVGVEAITMTK